MPICIQTSLIMITNVCKICPWPFAQGPFLQPDAARPPHQLAGSIASSSCWPYYHRGDRHATDPFGRAIPAKPPGSDVCVWCARTHAICIAMLAQSSGSAVSPRSLGLARSHASDWCLPASCLPWRLLLVLNLCASFFQASPSSSSSEAQAQIAMLVSFARLPPMHPRENCFTAHSAAAKGCPAAERCRAARGPCSAQARCTERMNLWQSCENSAATLAASSAPRRLATEAASQPVTAALAASRACMALQ